MTTREDALIKIRNNIANMIFRNETWASLSRVCQELGIPDYENKESHGKEKYLHYVVNLASDQIILNAGEILIDHYPGTPKKVTPSDLQVIQDNLWWIKSDGRQNITNVTRFQICEALEGEVFWGRFNIKEFFDSVGLPNVNCFNIGRSSDGSLLIDLQNTNLGIFFGGLFQEKKNPPNWTKITVRDFLVQAGIKEWPDERFCFFLERCVHPEVQSEDVQTRLVTEFNRFLEQDGFYLRKEEFKSGLPCYKVHVINSGVIGSPKYIIFAAIGPKPDIVIPDAINMDIRIVENADKCLVFSEPPPSGDLLWKMLVDWWQKIDGGEKSEKEIRKELGQRLTASLQEGPEKIFFETYFKHFAPIYKSKLPALLPQVYLHYDPRIQKERREPILVRQRMDFLMLLRNSLRIVIEIDGKQHYSDTDGFASPNLYATMVAEDRRIKLLGYEVFRFGGHEFQNPELCSQTIIDFFDRLFSKYSIQP